MSFLLSQIGSSKGDFVMSPMNDLIKLLDFSDCKTRTQVELRFGKISQELLQHYTFAVNGIKFKISEVELGLKLENVISDNIHCSTVQVEPGKIYIHKRGRSYKAGKHCGFDITCGGHCPDYSFFGTLMVKSITDVNTNEKISGTALSLLHLLGRKKHEKNFSAFTQTELDLLNNLNGSRIGDPYFKIESVSSENSDPVFLSHRTSIARDEDDDQYGGELLLRASTEEDSNKKSIKKRSVPIEKILVQKATVERQEQKEDEDSSNESSFGFSIPTDEQIKLFLDRHDLSIGGKYFNASNLRVVARREDLNAIGSGQVGCYFIFSTMKENEIPCISVDGYKGYQKSMQIGEDSFRCLYNGKGLKIKERLFQHIFNNHTLEKIKSSKNKNSTISGTGALSLDTITQEEALRLEEAKMYYPAKHKLKPIKKGLHPDSHLKLEDKCYFLNGIDIEEQRWKKYKFAICVIKTDSEFGKILIEEAFAVQNGRPPLCRRHG